MRSTRMCGLWYLALVFCSAAPAEPAAPAVQSAKRPGAPKAAPAPAIDEAYTAKIREYTTEKFFLTELVDHLPASPNVPAPDKVLGYAVGAPDRLTHTKDIYRYMRELEKASAG